LDGLIELGEGPVGHDFNWATVGPIFLEHGTSGVCLGEGTWEHETTSRGMGIGLTLGVSEH
jgi:hypothetical protein